MSDAVDTCRDHPVNLPLARRRKSFAVLMLSWKFELTQDEGDLEEGREGEAIDRPGNFF